MKKDCAGSAGGVYSWGEGVPVDKKKGKKKGSPEGEKKITPEARKEDNLAEEV